MSKERAAKHYRRVTTRQLASMNIFRVNLICKFKERPNFYGNSGLKVYFLKFREKIFWNLAFLFSFFLGRHLYYCKRNCEG